MYPLPSFNLYSGAAPCIKAAPDNLKPLSLGFGSGMEQIVMYKYRGLVSLIYFLSLICILEPRPVLQRLQLT